METASAHYSKAKIKTVVIDAGHGGKDSGSLGSVSKEKTIALNIALQVGKYIKENMPDVKVIYTRSSDKFIPLFERAEIANRNQADVFISIHCNSIPSKKSSIKGTETYVMGLHSTEENLSVAKRENEVILLEDNYSKHYQGYNPNSPEAHIILSMYRNAYLDQSILLAEKVEQQFKERTKRNSRGVKQAGFVVLKATAMPAVLIETGFLSNKEEEAYLNSEKGQSYLASAIYRAFREYRDVVEKAPKNANLTERAITPKISNSKNVYYRVLLSSSKNKINTSTAAWKIVKGLEVEKVQNGYQYLSDRYSSYKTVSEKQAYYRKNGFPDAGVVAYNGKDRITVSRAKALLGEK
jgi:N-acetylmuramoyl-L-alanine amidase